MVLMAPSLGGHRLAQARPGTAISRAALVCGASLLVSLPVLAGSGTASAPAVSPGPPAPAGAAPAGDAAAQDSWIAKAHEAQKKGSIFEALDAFDHAIKADPSRADIRLEYADLLRTAGFWLRSAAQYKAVLVLRPDSADCRLGYGELLLAEDC